ncbi:metallophosphoesterase [Enterococcus hermanniensis]|nr:metallophosphoesterase [Enterococcus hermanniensis]
MIVLCLIVILIASIIYCRYQTYRLVEKHFLVEKNTQLSIKKGESSTYTIAQISDSHFSPFYQPERFTKIVTQLNQAQPEIVLFTGDLIENYNYWQTHDCTAISRQLAKIQASVGKFAILGNHDYRSDGAAVVKKMLLDGGFTLLENQSILVDGISLTGIDDAQEGTPDYAVKTLPASFSLLMIHEPDQVKNIADISSFDLILAGHSHGGQIRFPFFPYKNYGSKIYDKGIYPLTITTSLVVNTGLGTTGPPLRFRVPPEILYFHIEKGSE